MPKVRQYQGVIGVRLPPETDSELRELLAATQLTASQLLRQLLQRAVRQELSQRRRVMQQQEAGTMT